MGRLKKETTWRERNRERIREISNRWVKNNPEKRRAANKKYNDKRRKLIREAVVNHYGGKCLCCGITKPEFLAIDHINGGGVQHMKLIKTTLSYWLYKNNYPEGYRILCHNCNQSKGYFGYCPHRNLLEDKLDDVTHL